jgi:DNA-binding transcriptional LysR family regulator
MAKGNVTKHVAWLEQQLGAQLLQRTTKSVRLTEAGVSLFENGKDLLERVERTEAAVRLSVQAPHGALRVGCPPAFGALTLVPLLDEFSAEHPDIQVLLCHDDGRLDLVREGFDLSVRIARRLSDSSLVARKVASVPQCVVAAESYLERNGCPRTPQQLTEHRCLVHTIKSPSNVWSFSGPGGPISVRVSGPLRANFGEALHQAALRGQGISMHPSYMVAGDLRLGCLRALLTDWRPSDMEIYAVFPSRRNLPVRTRLFVDFLQAKLSCSPPWGER